MNNFLKVLFVIVAGISVSFCSHSPNVSQKNKSKHQRAGNAPMYEVLGQRYFVLESSANFRERGVASWYGKKFHGRPTASGETYDMHAMTAAHRTLPLPTTVQVTNLKNGKSVTVLVNDRGPFAKNRIIDLSYAAAKQLDMVTAGTTLVEVVAIHDVTNIEQVPASLQSQLFLQLGAFADLNNANQKLSRLRASAMPALVDTITDPDGGTMHKVLVGPFSSVADYDHWVERAAALGYPETYLVRKSQ